MSVIDNQRSAAEAEAVRDELVRILEHPSFNQSSRCSRLLRYLVNASLIDDAEPAKERAIGHEVFGRSVGYDTYYDPVVRNAASDLRRRLRQYYHETTSPSRVRMELPNGRYLLEFVTEDEAATATPRPILAVDGVSELAHPEVPPLLPAETLHSKARHYGWKLYALVASLVCLLLIAAAVVYRTRHPSGRNAFWDSVVTDKARIVIAVGTNKAGAKLFPGKKLVTFANASAYADVVTLLKSDHRIDLVVKPDVDTTMDDIRNDTAILIGSPSNFWTSVLSANLRYHFSADGIPNSMSIVDSFHPEAHWTVPFELESGDDYGMVAKVQNSSTGGTVIIISGVGGNGTAAAAQFLTDDRYRDTLNQLLGHSTNAQIILRAPVVRGVIGSPQVVTSYTW